MFDDFFIRALIAGVGIALVTGPLGCFIIWRRLSFFGDTLAHAALLGVTMAVFFEINIAFSVFFISSAVALILIKVTTNYKITWRCFVRFISSLIISGGSCCYRIFNIYSI